MDERERKIQALLTAVERLLSELKHYVPPEGVALDDLKTLIKEIRDGQ